MTPTLQHINKFSKKNKPQNATLIKNIQCAKDDYP